MEKTHYTASRFNAISRTDNQELILFNSYTGAIVTFPKEEEQLVLTTLKTGQSDDETILASLVDSGFLVSDKVNELLRAQFLHGTQHRTDVMHLSILPTEECNFCCTYCYETFPRGKMTVEAREGLKKYVEDKAPILKHLSISWFGGEPLLVPDVLGELSESFMKSCSINGVDYSAEIATNGYFLTEELFRQLLNWQIKSFMITIDGPEDIHNARRKQRVGGSTYQKIIDNLRGIKGIEGDFEIHIRVNFDNSTLDSMTELIDILSANFADDKRFQVYFRPVGRWGGENDDQLPVCDSRTADTKTWEYTELSLNKGLNMSSYVESLLTPAGAVCYAAKPTSLVVSSDGKLYKCTLAFDDEMNQIGQINSDGSIGIDYDKLAFWVTSGEETDEVCQSCFFRPACQGNHCPYYRKVTGEQPCSYEKKEIKKVLNLIWKKYSTM